MDDREETKLTPEAERILGNLVNIKDEIIADAIRDRGGGQSQVSQLRTDYQTKKVSELANLAAVGDTDAKTAIKILKQARKKREKYSGR